MKRAYSSMFYLKEYIIIFQIQKNEIHYMKLNKSASVKKQQNAYQILEILKEISVGGVAVSIVAFQAADPGSTPG